jgi:hypothetical protein
VDAAKAAPVQPVKGLKKIGRRFQSIPFFRQNLQGPRGVPLGGWTAEKKVARVFPVWQGGHLPAVVEIEGGPRRVVAREESWRAQFI